MNLNKKKQRNKKASTLINYEVTGNASVLAQRLGISRSQLFIEIETIKSYGVDIQFDRSKKSFVFSGQKKIIVREPIVITDREDLSTINAGFFS
jgi:biotin operon repressor